jgi:hypothetical protein
MRAGASSFDEKMETDYLTVTMTTDDTLLGDLLEDFPDITHITTFDRLLMEHEIRLARERGKVTSDETRKKKETMNTITSQHMRTRARGDKAAATLVAHLDAEVSYWQQLVHELHNVIASDHSFEKFVQALRKVTR